MSPKRDPFETFVWVVNVTLMTIFALLLIAGLVAVSFLAVGDAEPHDDGFRGRVPPGRVTFVSVRPDGTAAEGLPQSVLRR